MPYRESPDGRGALIIVGLILGLLMLLGKGVYELYKFLFN